MNAGNAASMAVATRQALARALIGEIASTVGAEQVHNDPADLVRAACADRVGLVGVTWPGVDRPLWVRAGSRDADDLIAAMAAGLVPVNLGFVPRRIIEIGAGAGYRSVALAVTYPGATIASVEPIPVQARLHSLNTLPWRQIIGIRAAIAETVAVFAVTTSAETGHADLVPSANGVVGALSFGGLMQHLGWDATDLVLIDPAACPDLVDERSLTVLTRARAVAIRRPGPALGTAWDEPRYLRHVTPDWDWYVRRDDARPMPPARRDYVFDVGGSAVSVTQVDVANETWAYFPIGDTGFRLHPNGAGAAPARLTVQHDLAGPRRFETDVRLNHAGANPVRFRVTISAADTGRVIQQAEQGLRGGEAARMGVDMPLFIGKASIEFATEMADGGSNGYAWAEFLEPVFL
jgi:hypothetical protein